MRDTELMDVPQSEIDHVWKFLPGHPLQAMVHNFLVKGIATDRDRLEKCEADQLFELQASIRVRRELLGFIHSKDPSSNKS